MALCNGPMNDPDIQSKIAALQRMLIEVEKYIACSGEGYRTFKRALAAWSMLDKLYDPATCVMDMFILNLESYDEADDCTFCPFEKTIARASDSCIFSVNRLPSNRDRAKTLLAFIQLKSILQVQLQALNKEKR